MINSFTGPFRFLSNFQAATVVLDGELYPTVENAYQAAKTTNPKLREIFTEISARDAKKKGKELPIRKDWDEVKMEVMYNLNLQKYRDHPILLQKLLDTGQQELIEGNWWGDTFWGVCNGVGKNHLGKMLMNIRKRFRD